MRLLETTPTSASSPVPAMREFVGAQIPPYAILSHTWADEEVTLQQLQHGASAGPGTAAAMSLQARAGFRKVQQTCALARTRDGLAYAWVDTCCIDKRSSAELTEAINSMYAWYRDAAVCYVFLSDLEPSAFAAGAGGASAGGGSEAAADELARALPACRWFTRGWTLQELLAPREVLFFDKSWNYRGSKAGLAGLLSRITGIPEALLRGDAELGDYAVARRMSWAARRETTRVEDLAYCLLGIFDVNMSLIYGEGLKAFERLQAAIVQSTADLSIFAWTDDRNPSPMYAPMLAESPRQFAWCSSIEAAQGDSVYANFAVITRGVQTDASLLQGRWLVLDVRCSVGNRRVGICLRKIAGGLYARYKPSMALKLDTQASKAYTRLSLETITLATRLPRRYPFHKGDDPVLGNRFSAIRIDWGTLRAWSRGIKPRSHWDAQDRAFFSCNKTSWGWCVWISRIELPRGDNSSSPPVYLNLLVGCFQWSVGSPTVLVVMLDHVDPIALTLLESQLDLVKFEDSSQAFNLIRNIVAGKLEENQTAHGTGATAYTVRYWDRAKGSDKSDGPETRVTVSLERRSYPSICVNPVKVLKVGLVEDVPDAVAAIGEQLAAV
ncbi:9df33e65-a608-457b-8d0c-f02dfb23ae30 [Thermothielavioides terrestris]|uniref:Heterokaryon incompatibility domain-containing protein n=2 Tax=Thermothielavioides terrestris TaxID=2587410 RepID=G2QV27_THETT|nr:uncharacterized protein THITE_2041148 [Thermothielavioides terrestris NRRL 8126]AEO64625.1 hypothetical protein THITE_2041148 [Thermothielavioides terrestris NRRL 8126]SPQ26525.1 9df33e65-a608-457b-8d0c-f02dfb23ae30 [Thermothielavioides terrestris]